MSVDKQGERVARFLASHGVKEFDWNLLGMMVDSILEKRLVSVHPYGFFIIKLVERPDLQVRLHTWLKNIRPRQDPDWLPHDHCFIIDSLVLYGSLTSQTWQVHRNPDGNGVIYDVGYDGDFSVLRRTDDVVQCNLDTESDVEEGNSYEVPIGTFHSTLVDPSSLAITLCVMHSPISARSTVIGDRYAAREYRFRRNSWEVWHIQRLQESLRPHIPLPNRRE